MKLYITKGGVMFWTGNRWNENRESAQLYTWEELPEVLIDGNEVLYLERLCSPFDAGYYESNEEPDPSAWVRAAPGTNLFLP